MADNDRQVSDREALDAWFGGTGATVVLVFFMLAAIAGAWTVWNDSPIMAIALIAAVPAYVVLKKKELL